MSNFCLRYINITNGINYASKNDKNLYFIFRLLFKNGVLAIKRISKKLLVIIIVISFGLFLPPANEVCEGYVFTPVCQSFSSQGGAWSWGCLLLGVPGPGGCLVPGGAWCRGVPGAGGFPEETPPRRLLLRAVRILLECILVFQC